MTANHLARSARNSLSKGLLEITILSSSPSRVYEAGLAEATCIQFDYRIPPPQPSKLLYWFKLSFNELYWSAIRGIF